MTISPGADGRVHFRSVLSFENDHPALDHGICGSCRDDMSADLLPGASTAGVG